MGDSDKSFSTPDSSALTEIKKYLGLKIQKQSTNIYFFNRIFQKYGLAQKKPMLQLRHIDINAGDSLYSFSVGRAFLNCIQKGIGNHMAGIKRFNLFCQWKIHYVRCI